MQRIKAGETKTEQARITKGGQLAFAKGGVKPEGSGRKKGQGNRTSLVLKETIMNAMTMVGSNNRGKDGADGYLARIAWNYPELFVRLLEKVLPFSLSGAGGGAVQIEYTNRVEIIQRMKERGLPLPPSLLAAPKRNPNAAFEEGKFDEVIEDE